MRIFKCDKLKWDIKCLISYAIVVILAIICGIVLFKINNISNYVYNFADIYIFYVFNFNSGSLFFSHFLSEIVYLYVVFLLVYFTKLKFLVYPILFIRALFTVLYIIVLCAFFGTEGIIVAVIVFIPSFLCSLAFYLVLCEQCRQLCVPFAYLCPAVCALINSVALLLLVNVIFRVIVVIV